MTDLLDTNACIRYVNGCVSDDIVRRLQPMDVVVCCVAKVELSYSARGGPDTSPEEQS